MAIEGGGQLSGCSEGCSAASCPHGSVHSPGGLCLPRERRSFLWSPQRGCLFLTFTKALCTNDRPGEKCQGCESW